MNSIVPSMAAFINRDVSNDFVDTDVTFSRLMAGMMV